MKKVTDLETTIFVYDGVGKLVAEYSTATPPSNPTTNYTATDQLGSPRVVTDALGQVVSRRDFLPFGEEIFADGAIRTTANKYSLTGQDAVRQRFTGYQRDLETGLDFAEARYYNNAQGRFTAVDPLLASGKSANPQTFNRYVYGLNNPITLHDPTGLQAGKAAPPEKYNGPMYVDPTGNHFSTARSSDYPNRVTEDAYATAGGKNYLVSRNGYVEIGVPPPSEEDRAAEHTAETMATARKIVAEVVATTIHYEVNPLGIDVSDPGTQMAIIEASGGLAAPIVAEENIASELGAVETGIKGTTASTAIDGVLAETANAAITVRGTLPAILHSRLMRLCKPAINFLAKDTLNWEILGVGYLEVRIPCADSEWTKILSPDSIRQTCPMYT